MSEEFEVVLDGKLPKPIHPTIDVVDDHLYFGLLLPVKDRDGNIQEAYGYINDDLELFPVTEENLRKRGLTWRNEPQCYLSKLTIDGVREILNGAVCDVCVVCRPTFELINELKRYIEFADPYEYMVVALWIIGTYLQPIWKSYPYIGISGLKATGKSKLLTFLSLTAFNGVLSCNISTAALYRLIHDTKCSLLIDEAHRLSIESERRSELFNILYAGYKRGAFVFRAEESKRRHIPRRFDVFSPKAFVTFQGLEEILNDRSVNIVMLRSMNKDILNTEIDETNPVWEKIRNCLYVFALKNWRKIRELYNTIPRISFIEGRAWELWKPLITLHMFLYGEDETIDFANNYIKAKVQERVEDGLSSPEAILLTALATYVNDDRFYSISEIKSAVLEVIKLEHGGELDSEPKWLSSKWIGRTLTSQFKISKRRVGGKPQYHLSREIVRELCRRYNVSEGLLQITQTSQTTPVAKLDGYMEDNSGGGEVE